MTTPLTTYDVHYPTRGTPFWFAQCTACPDNHVEKFAPYLGVTYSRAESIVSNWARDHRCHPAGRGLAADVRANWADEYLCDRMQGQFEGTA